ncbi:PQQ-like domain-containing protein [Haloechinothrix alba]|uniref:PQQ-like domain-containing protein n=1 Tax=Haloechinothrix alba TaxID=664784 RepID=A0A238XZI7_9PSEU|nr:PQQ-binding-like beta-propeller repeat protein [Haloechinothrix alba]SNR64405.1 PQQ-like domain-containing protein [Haloechinothrix alba]
MTVRRKFPCMIAALGLAAATAASPASTASPQHAAPGGDERDRSSGEVAEVLFVGNNWDGTADVLTPDGELEPLARVDIVPDLDKRLREVYTDPERLGYYLGIRALVGEGNDQYVDDMYTTEDGRTLVVSRPSLADVVGIDLAGGELVWRFEVDGHRSDHMAVSPDGEHVAVSASTGNVVHVLDIETGEEVGQFPSGDSPHENVYSADGEKIFHASIGHVYTPLDRPALDSTKGERHFQIVDADSYEVLERIDMGAELDEAGYPDYSSAVRPMTFSPDERYVYFQVSFFHGFIEYDLAENRVVSVVNLPQSEEAANTEREQYLLDSAHHGIAMNPQGTDLCVAGTMSDYATIVSRDRLRHGELVEGGEKPYWATSSSDGEHCFVSWSGSDRVSALSYDTGEEVASTRVGDHPQRMRLGHVRTDWLAEQDPPRS